MWLRQSTASQEISLGQFLDSTDGNTEEDGLTIASTDIKLRKGGATILTSKNSGGATNISNGVYHATLDATDTNTLGILEVYVHVTGALATKSTYMILPATSYDALVVNGLNNFDASNDTVANVTLVSTTTTNTDMRGTDGANTTTPPTAAQIWAEPTRVLTAGTNIALAKGVGVTGFNDLSFSDMWTGTLTESYAADGAAMTPAQSLHMMWSDLRSPQQISTTWTDFRLDNATVAMTFTLDNATTPTKKTRVA